MRETSGATARNQPQAQRLANAPHHLALLPTGSANKDRMTPRAEVLIVALVNSFWMLLMVCVSIWVLVTLMRPAVPFEQVARNALALILIWVMRLNGLRFCRCKNKCVNETAAR